MSIWVTLTEAETLVAGYPVTVPDNLDQWLNAAYVLISKNTAYSFPTDPTEDMKLGLSLYACVLGNQEGSSANVQAQGVVEFKIGNFSQKYSEKLITGLDKFPPLVEALFKQYRVGRDITAQLRRTYPPN